LRSVQHFDSAGTSSHIHFTVTAWNSKEVGTPAVAAVALAKWSATIDFEYGDNIGVSVRVVLCEKYRKTPKHPNRTLQHKKATSENNNNQNSQ
jgi:hypothetical protein